MGGAGLLGRGHPVVAEPEIAGTKAIDCVAADRQRRHRLGTGASGRAQPAHCHQRECHVAGDARVRELSAPDHAPGIGRPTQARAGSTRTLAQPVRGAFFRLGDQPLERVYRRRSPVAQEPAQRCAGARAHARLRLGGLLVALLCRDGRGTDLLTRRQPACAVDRRHPAGAAEPGDHRAGLSPAATVCRLPDAPGRTVAADNPGCQRVAAAPGHAGCAGAWHHLPAGTADHCADPVAAPRSALAEAARSRAPRHAGHEERAGAVPRSGRDGERSEQRVSDLRRLAAFRSVRRARGGDGVVVHADHLADRRAPGDQHRDHRHPPRAAASRRQPAGDDLSVRLGHRRGQLALFRHEPGDAGSLQHSAAGPDPP